MMRSLRLMQGYETSFRVCLVFRQSVVQSEDVLDDHLDDERCSSFLFRSHLRYVPVAYRPPRDDRRVGGQMSCLVLVS